MNEQQTHKPAWLPPARPLSAVPFRPPSGTAVVPVLHATACNAAYGCVEWFIYAPPADAVDSSGQVPPP